MAALIRAVCRGGSSLSHKLFALLGLASDRYYLLADVLPYALAACGLRVALASLGVPPIFDSDTTTSFAQAALFVIAIVLSGVLAEYSEAESLPGSIACELEALSSKLVLASSTAAARSAADGGGTTPWPAGVSLASLHGELVSVLEAIMANLGRIADDAELSAVLDAAAQHVAAAVHALESAVSADSILGHFDSLREHMMRISIIQRVDYIDAGYTLMDVLVWSSLGMSVCCEYSSSFAAIASIFLSTLMVLYIKHLVHDIDEPFSYRPEHLLPTLEHAHLIDEEIEMGAGESPLLQVEVHGHGRAEIDLFPLCNAYARLAQKAGVDMGQPSVNASDEGTHSQRFPPPSAFLAGLGSAERKGARLAFVARLKHEMREKWIAVAKSKLSSVGDSDASPGGAKKRA